MQVLLQDDQLLTGKLEAASAWVGAYTASDPGLDSTPAPTTCTGT